MHLIATKSKSVKTMRHTVYIIECGGGRFYTGYTTDLERRLTQHRTGKGAKFTRAFGAGTLLYHETFKTKSMALKREHEIKQLTRIKKQILVNQIAKM